MGARSETGTWRHSRTLAPRQPLVLGSITACLASTPQAGQPPTHHTLRGLNMFIAMNRFRIALGREAEFEEIWRNRDSHLDEMGAFRSSTCFGVPATRSAPSTHPTRSGTIGNRSKTGPSRRTFAPHTRARVRRPGFISGIRNSKGSKRCSNRDLSRRATFGASRQRAIRVSLGTAAQ